MSLSRTLKHLFPDYAEGDWKLSNDGSGGYIKEWNRVEPQPTTIEIAAAESIAMAENEKSDLKVYASLYGFTLSNSFINPLTSVAISSASTRSEIEHDLVKAESYWHAAYDDATDATRILIDAARAERKRVTLVTLEIRADIDSGKVTTKAQVENDSRWKS